VAESSPTSIEPPAPSLLEPAVEPAPQALSSPSAAPGGSRKFRTWVRVRGWFRNRPRFGMWYLVPPVAAYVLWWSFATVTKFYAGNASVYDLGLEMQGIWWPLHAQGLSASYYFLEATSRPDSVLFSPLSLPVSYPLLLVFQTVALASGTFAVFDIALGVWGARLPAYLLALVYLIYFPMAGVNWFDFHLQALFVPGFLFAYAMLLRRHYRLSFALFFLAGAATFGYMVLVIGFSGLSLAEVLIRQRWYRQPPNRREWRFLAALFSASTLFFVYQDFYFSSYLGGSSYLVTSAKYVVPTGAIPWSNRISVLLFLLAPVLLLVLLAPKWLALLSPFAVLVLTSGSSSYGFPAIFQNQFVAMAIPMVFIGSVYGARRLLDYTRRPSGPREEALPPVVRRMRRLARDRLRLPQVLTIMLVVTVSFAVFFEPYGPLNGATRDNFALGPATTLNWTTFHQMQDLVNLVPRATPWVLFQNNMPSVLPRPLAYHETPLTPSFLDWLNATPYDAQTGQFPLDLDGVLLQVPIQYAIVDPHSSWFTVSGLVPNTSMQNFAQSMIASGAYGILGEADGMFVLERGYVGPPQYYVPYSAMFSARALYAGLSSSPSGMNVISGTMLYDAPVWHGPYVPFAPGTYRVTYSLLTTDNSSQNRIDLVVASNETHTVFGEVRLTGANFNATGTWVNISMTVTAATVQPLVEFEGLFAFWSGTISIRYVEVTQTAVPTLVS